MELQERHKSIGTWKESKNNNNKGKMCQVNTKKRNLIYIKITKT